MNCNLSNSTAAHLLACQDLGYPGQIKCAISKKLLRFVRLYRVNIQLPALTESLIPPHNSLPRPLHIRLSWEDRRRSRLPYIAPIRPQRSSLVVWALWTIETSLLWFKFKSRCRLPSRASAPLAIQTPPSYIFSSFRKLFFSPVSTSTA